LELFLNYAFLRAFAFSFAHIASQLAIFLTGRTSSEKFAFSQSENQPFYRRYAPDKNLNNIGRFQITDI
jgi:hypothetical protein